MRFLLAPFLLLCLTFTVQADPASPPPAAAAAPKPEIKKLDGNRSELGGINFDTVTREISLPCAVNMTKGNLEFALVRDTGKVHESLLSTAVSPLNLNIVLLLLNYKPQPGWFLAPGQRQPLEDIPDAGKLEAHLRWTEGKGKEKTARLESWVEDFKRRKPAADGPWVYNGSRIEDNAFAAETDGSFIALYVDSRSILNNPREDTDSDEVWFPAKDLPAKGTKVTLILKPVAAAPPQPEAPAKPKPETK